MWDSLSNHNTQKPSFQKALLYYSKERANFPSMLVKTRCKKTPKNCAEWTRSTITSAFLHQPELWCPKFTQVPFWKVYLSIFEPSSAWCIPHPLIPPKENHFSRYPDTHSCFHSWFVTVSTVSCLTVTTKLHLLLAVILVSITSLLN